MPGGAVGDGSATAAGGRRVAQLRLAVTAQDYDQALRFYRDVLGMPEEGTFTSQAGGRVTILDAGRATLEIADPPYAAYIDEVEVGRRVAGPIRVAFEVADASAATAAAEDAGARVLAPPTTTPWNSSNARLEAPAGLQITLFAELGDPD
jgi:lactoylglutathione lyase